MAHSTVSPLQRQVARVRRRLLLQTLVRSLVWCWFGALTLTAVWFLVQPLLIDDNNPLTWIRWAVLIGAMIVGTGVAVAVAVMRRASPVQAALALDEQFRLKERVTTSLMLCAEEIASPAGAALLADANQRVEPLRVAARFPVRLPWTAMLAPAVGIVLVLLAVFYHPDFGQARTAAHPAPSRMRKRSAYSGRTSRAGQADRLGKRTMDYLVNQRGVDAGRMTIVNGGYRDTDFIEIVICPPGATPPQPTPSVQPGDAQPAQERTRPRKPRRRTDD